MPAVTFAANERVAITDGEHHGRTGVVVEPVSATGAAMAISGRCRIVQLDPLPSTDHSISRLVVDVDRLRPYGAHGFCYVCGTPKMSTRMMTCDRQRCAREHQHRVNNTDLIRRDEPLPRAFAEFVFDVIATGRGVTATEVDRALRALGKQSGYVDDRDAEFWLAEVCRVRRA